MPGTLKKLRNLPSVYQTFADIFRLQRKLQIGKSDYVLDVGSGGNPNIRANVLCDKYLGDHTERGGFPLVVDRPFVVGDALHLPFKDKAFDYVICSHLIEHVDDPEQLIGELQRVAPRGYIEAPSRVFEKVIQYPFHKWFVWVEDGELIMAPKPAYALDPEISAWFKRVLQEPSMYAKFWANRHRLGAITSFVWDGEIKHKVVTADNPVSAAPPHAALTTENEGAWDDLVARRPLGLGEKLKSALSRHARRASDRTFDYFLSLLACPWCRSSLSLEEEHSHLRCQGCGRLFPFGNGVPVLLREYAP